MAVHMQLVAICLASFIILQNTQATVPGSPHRKFEYKLSFKGPHLVQKDGTVPFWEHSGNAIASDESIRITPSLRSKKGRVWSKNLNTHQHWEIEVVFRISGRGRVGADGLAIWYTEQPGIEGPVFGSNDMWKGLGIFFDSFDNDGQHNNPYVMAMFNDGTKAYDHYTDGMNQQLGGCLRDFRNKPFPVRAKIEYYMNALTLYVHNGMTSTGDQYELCMRAENVYLPSQGYFGVTAATGGLADDHDVQAFLTHSLTPPENVATGTQQVSDDDRLKFEQEFDEYYQKLQKAKEEFRKEHPDKHQFEDDEERWFEEQGARELKQIFEGQNYIGKTVNDLHRKLDEVIGRQERTLSQLSIMSQTGSVQAQGQPNQQGGQVPVVDTIKRFEVDTLMANQRELISNMREFRTTINDIQAKATNMQRAGTQQGGAVGYQDADMKNNINTIVHDMKTLLNKPQVTAPACPPSTTSCVTPFLFFVFVAIQIAAFIGYTVYRTEADNGRQGGGVVEDVGANEKKGSSKEAAAKKFY